MFAWSFVVWKILKINFRFRKKRLQFEELKFACGFIVRFRDGNEMLSLYLL